MEPMLKYVDLLCSILGPEEGQMHGYPGHPEIELALLRLYERTGDEKHLRLAEYFLKERGNPSGCNGRHFYAVEAEKRGDNPRFAPAFYPEPMSLWYDAVRSLPLSQLTVIGITKRTYRSPNKKPSKAIRCAQYIS